MDLESWIDEYRNICQKLDILPKDDYEARDAAAILIGDRKQFTGKLDTLIFNHDVAIFGAGPSLETGVKKFKKEDKVVISADGATSCLLQNGINPDIVVTDLDGDIKDQLLADGFGAIMVVHAHADNTKEVKQILPKIKNPVVTTQVEPLNNVHNYFGFTDGDRAVFLAKHFGARAIELIGFDFGSTVGKYSDPKNPTNHKATELKKKKLEIAQLLISMQLP